VLLIIGANVDNRFCAYHQPAISKSKNNLVTLPKETAESKEERLDKLALAEYIDKDGQYDNRLCNVFRSGINNKCKISSYGFLATFLSCSVIVGFTEQPCSEGSK